MTKCVVIAGSNKELLKKVESILNYESFLTIAFESEIELLTYLADNSKPKDYLIISENVGSLSSEDIFFTINKSTNNNYFPTIFLTERNTQKIRLNSIGIPSFNIYSKDVSDIEELKEFIYRRISFYEEFISTIKSQEYFSGNLININFTDLLFNIEKFNKTGVLNICSKNGINFDVYFESGKLVYAVGDNGCLPTENFEAVKEIFKLKNMGDIKYEFMSDISSPEISLVEKTSVLISKIFKEFDEHRDSLGIRKTTVIQSNNNQKPIINNGSNLTNKGVKMMVQAHNYDLEKAVEIAEGTYWVSQRNPKTLLQTNTFLRRFKNENREINLLIDPGASEFFPTISRKVSSVVRDMSKVHMYSINHQDPDVGMNSTFIAKMNPKSVCLCTEDTWRLVHFYEIPKSSYKNVYSFENKKVSLSTSTDHVLEFVPTPYCHFIGAFAIYDRSSRVLYTGDLFGGLSPANDMGLVATEANWEGIKTFHQIYMPSKKAIQNAIHNIRALDIPPVMIVPQHGAILTGQIMEQFLNRLYNLDVGMDLFNKSSDDELTPIYMDIISILYEKLVESIGLNEAIRLFDFGNQNIELYHLVNMDSSGIKDIYSQHEQALNQFLSIVSKYSDPSIVNEIKSLAIKETLTRRLPMPINMYDEATNGMDDDISSPFGQAEVKEQEESIFS